ncbi:hypothetical protein [Prosthecobacter sp.]|uniref:hypothetical protein n=1 Tax=Prosthecobacter sp. TaxID=1965333 RepID=UPI003783497A
MISKFFLVASISCLAACQSKQEAPQEARDLKEEARMHKAGLVLIPDLQHSSNWEKLIHVDMGVPDSKIHVEAGPGYTTVTITDLANRADAESVAQELRAIAAKKPEKFGTTKVEVKLANAPATINPFVLPTQAAPQAPTNPGSDLPTLSLPPFRIDGR